MRKFAIAAVALSFVLAAAYPAYAIRIYGATSIGNQTGNATTLIDLGADLDSNDIGDTLEFNIKKKTTGIITFSAECSVEGSEESWISVQILVNGTAVGQSNQTSDAFCSGTATDTSDDSWVMASMNIPYNFMPGNVDLQVQVSLHGGATGWWLGDTGVSVVVTKR
ncbi:MAG: hypothetical protein GKS06_11090 [Acidobacteria bacterium]|nr:hypothetical protein [Acidobacteriota bacterium]